MALSRKPVASSSASASARVRVTVWRLVKASYAATALTGESAAMFGGRWNSMGTKVVYAAQTASLALLELLVHLDDAAALRHYVMFPLTFSPQYVRRFPSRQLPAGWDAPAPTSATQHLGDAFIASAESPILAVPSAILPQELNFIFNPEHPGFTRVNVGKPQRLPCDSRLAALRRA